MSNSFGQPFERGRVPALIALTTAAILILGYHPAAEDGGIYSAALLQRLHPDLFAHSHPFVTAHLGRSLYLPLLAALHHILPLSLPWFFLLLHALSVFAVLFTAHKLVAASSFTPAAQFGAVFFLALGLSLPVAGTALYVADPYLTARSISTPLLLLCLVTILQQRWIFAFVLFALTVLLHPLMAVWGSLLLLGTAASATKRPVRATAILSVGLLAVSGGIAYLAPHENSTMQMLAHSRSYWFLSQWHWYEVAGALIPPVLLFGMTRLPRTSSLSPSANHLLRGTIFAFLLPVVISLLFVHADTSRLLLARMQPLRALHFGYVLFLLMLGAWLGQHLLQRSVVRWIFAALVLSLPLVCMQRSLYASSNHLEMPWTTPRNPWARAFLWAKQNTPVNALFALDARYVYSPAEDANCFRAIAERSSLPDAAKDGGVASVSSQLADTWLRGVQAQQGLDTISDAIRLQRLQPLGVTWLVLRADATTSFACPYANEAAKVCKLP